MGEAHGNDIHSDSSYKLAGKEDNSTSRSMDHPVGSPRNRRVPIDSGLRHCSQGWRDMETVSRDTGEVELQVPEAWPRHSAGTIGLDGAHGKCGSAGG